MSKTSIIESIKAVKPEAKPLPRIPAFPTPDQNAVELFSLQAAQTGSRVVKAQDFGGLNDAVSALYPQAESIASPLLHIKTTVDLGNCPAADLQHVEVAVVKGLWGVAENGAVWITEREAIHRVLPFITQHLTIVLPASRIVHTMHQAYANISIDETGFGLFVAGPSKTADIEQSLVIGAQAARSLTIILT